MGEGKEEAAERQFCLKECAHTHITRSDYLEKLASRQKMEWVGVLSTAGFAETKEWKRIGESKDGSSTNEKMIHVDTYYKYSVTMYFWVGSL